MSVPIVVDDLDVEYINRVLRDRALKRKAVTLCECGCGTEIPARAAKGGPRRFVKGHHMRLAAGEPLTYRLDVGFTHAELTIIRDRARRGNTSMSQLVRAAMLGELKRWQDESSEEAGN